MAFDVPMWICMERDDIWSTLLVVSDPANIAWRGSPAEAVKLIDEEFLAQTKKNVGSPLYLVGSEMRRKHWQNKLS